MQGIISFAAITGRVPIVLQYPADGLRPLCELWPDLRSHLRESESGSDTGKEAQRGKPRLTLRIIWLFQVSSWITHVIVSQPTHDDRKVALTAIIRIIETCWNIGELLQISLSILLLGNFNAAVEILMGLKSEKLRPFWLSLRPEEKHEYEQVRCLCLF